MDKITNTNAEKYKEVFEDAGVEIPATSVLALIGLIAELVYRLETSRAKAPLTQKAEVILATAFLDIQEKLPPRDDSEMNQKDRDALAYLVDSLNYLVQGYHEKTFPRTQ